MQLQSRNHFPSYDRGHHVVGVPVLDDDLILVPDVGEFAGVALVDGGGRRTAGRPS